MHYQQLESLPLSTVSSPLSSPTTLRVKGGNGADFLPLSTTPEADANAMIGDDNNNNTSGQQQVEQTCVIFAHFEDVAAAKTWVAAKSYLLHGFKV